MKLIDPFKKHISTIFLATLLFSCSKITVDPPTNQLVNETVFSRDASSIAAQVAIYAAMETDGMAYILSLHTGLSGDEFNNYQGSGGLFDLYNNSIAPTNTEVKRDWTNFYNYIYQSNSVIEGLTNSTGTSEAVRLQLLGEAYFTRAFCHFYLVNLFGEIPLVLGTNYNTNRVLVRTSTDLVYEQIIKDLVMAKSKLNEGYMSGTNTLSTERVRPNKWTAAALLAKVYLYTGKWAEAETEATSVISQSSMYSLVPNLNNVFLKNAPEAIWQLMATSPTFNSYPGAMFVQNSTPTVVDISAGILGNFETGDNRKSAWIKTVTVLSKSYYYPFKYKVGQNAGTVTEYTTILRLPEVYLIRSECRAQLNNISGAQGDLNMIRNRAGLPNTTSNSKALLLDAIGRERVSELFTEFGDRWFNLKRTGQADVVLGALKGSRWQVSDKLYPIPQSELDNSPVLNQNPGY